MPGGAQRFGEKAEEVRDGQACRAFELGEADQRRAPIFEKSLGDEGAQDFGRIFVPPSFGDVEVFGVVLGQDVRESGAAQEFGVLLADPGAVRARFGFPIEGGFFHVAAAGVAFENDRLGGQRAEQKIERGGIGVGASGVAVPGDLHENAVWLGGGQDALQ